MSKIMQIGRDPQYNHRSARAVFAPQGISPCLCSAMGMGGDYVPYILLPPPQSPRQERIAYKWRANGIRAYDADKGTNISEQMIFFPSAISPTITREQAPCVLLSCDNNVPPPNDTADTSTVTQARNSQQPNASPHAPMTSPTP